MLQRAHEETTAKPKKHRKGRQKTGEERKLHPEVSQGWGSEGNFLLDKTLWSCKKAEPLFVKDRWLPRWPIEVKRI